MVRADTVEDVRPHSGPAFCADSDTVYLRRQVEGWSVWLGGERLLIVGDEERAFQYACDAHRCEGRGTRRLLILSGPSWA